MKKNLAIIISLTILLLTTTQITATTETNSSIDEITTQISENIDTSRFKVEPTTVIPSNVEPLSFDTWQDAVNWINSIAPISQSQQTMSTYSNDFSFFPDENYRPKGKLGSVWFHGIKKNETGVFDGIAEYNVPGINTQKVIAKHYFRYTDGHVVDWDVYCDIHGIGLATYDLSYKRLERHDVTGYRRYFGVCVGTVGYYIEVGGYNLGVYESLELTYAIYRES